MALCSALNCGIVSYDIVFAYAPGMVLCCGATAVWFCFVVVYGMTNDLDEGIV